RGRLEKSNPSSGDNKHRLTKLTSSRLHPASSTLAWQPKRSTLHQYVEVDLGATRNVLGVATQGSKDAGGWVSQYELHYSDGGKRFRPYRVASGQAQVKRVRASSLAPSTVPSSSVRQPCQEALGMESSGIPDSSITASSSASEQRSPKFARLNHRHGDWTPKYSDGEQHLQVDLGYMDPTTKTYLVTAVATQGSTHRQGGWLSQYLLLYSVNGRDWRTYTDKHGRHEVFDGNNDTDTVARRTLAAPVIARYVRIVPIRWQHSIALRLELYGCGYATQSVQFDGASFLRYDLYDRGQTDNDAIYVRLRTTRPDGVLLYARGAQGDYICVEMSRGRMFVNFNLGCRQKDDSPSVTFTTQKGFVKVAGLLSSTALNVSLEFRTYSDVGLLFYNQLAADGSLKVSDVPFHSITFPCVSEGVYCNCDAGQARWLGDEGWIRQKEHLPVAQVLVGDTGAPDDDSEAYWSLGPLRCTGDTLFDNMVTFRKEDAFVAFPRPPLRGSFDIYLQFKTTVAAGVLVYCDGPQDNFLKLTLTGARSLQLQYNAGGAMQILQVKVAPALRLDDDAWHAVQMERNGRQAKVVVDGGKPTAIAEAAAIFRELELTSDLTIGAKTDRTEGFVGVMRALMVNGEMLDLRGAAERGVYGVLPGDAPKCASAPCMNNGTCLERYSSYACNCTLTPFDGEICTEEIGVKLRAPQRIRYDLPDFGLRSTATERIRVGLSTTRPQGALMSVYSAGRDFFSMEFTEEGAVRFRFSYDGRGTELVIEDDHVLTNGRTMRCQFSRRTTPARIYRIDEYDEVEKQLNIPAEHDTRLNQLLSIYIGRNKTMSDAEGFVGCISRVQFDELFPLKRLFDDPISPNIKAEAISGLAFVKAML
ncbi:PREDICTED: neurexin-4-like, partial [Priapulus caudatus]|uniref:Neurexin-4-like n=1 Tax=Priapulus caudatus TaxID=37621 RepID=A0ABM1EH24_PRICU